MTFSDTALSTLVLVSLGLSLTAVAMVALRAVGKRSRLSSMSPDKRLEAQLDAHAKAINRLETAVRQLATAERELEDLADTSIRNVGVVRFDAFEDMGGRLSFSAALLDGRGDGVVITSINGRQESRSYAKPVARGESVHNLSDEEQQAIREALGARRQIAEAR
ncbi:MAG TPA: DUF4446 family protein [Actinomycetota bacterium]|nr:DUF4446 family protein [Actinomycetota bacterium]